MDAISSSRKKATRVLAGVIVVMLAGAATACGLGYWALDAYLHDARYALYQDFRLRSYDYGETFDMFGLNEEHGSLPWDLRPAFVQSRLQNVFIEVKDKRLGSLSDLEERDVVTVVEHEWEYEVDEPTPDLPHRMVHCRFLFTVIEFRDGELISFHTGQSPNSVRFAAKMEGPYYSEPMTKEEMVEVFGEPLRIERGKVPAKGRLF